MSVVSFQNPGLIDLTALTMMGISVKETDNPIGYFGTGAKFASAIILRNGGSITIYRGMRKHSFSTKKRTIRGEKIEIAYFDGVEKFATSLGRNWEMWMAYRELHSNTLDEDGWVSPTRLKPKSGHTTIIIEGCREFSNWYERRNEIFIEGDTIYRSNDIEMYPSSGKHIYYRGIRVHESERYPYLYSYNLLKYQTLTEDRTLASSWGATTAIGEAIVTMTDRHVLKQILLADPECYFEGNIIFTQHGKKAGETFYSVVEELHTSPDSGRLNKSALKLLNKSRESKQGPRVFELNAQQNIMLAEAYTAIENLGLIGVRETRLIPVESLGSERIGLADNGSIWLARRAFTQGLTYLVSVLIEEYLHITQGFEDESREFQNFILNMLADAAVQMSE